MTERNDKGQFATPDEKQISRESEELLGLYLDSLKSQKRDTKGSTSDTRRREVRYWLAYCERQGIDPLAAVTGDVRGYIQSITDQSDTTIDSYYRSVQSFYAVIENDQMHDRLELEYGHPCRDKRDIHLKEDYGVHASTSEYKRQHTTAGIDLDGTRNGDAVLALKPQIVEKLFDNVPGKRKQTRLRNEIAVRLNWYTGCRADELSRMQVEKIDWDQCCINIRSAKINAKENPELARRDVFFPESFKVQLKRWCERVRHAYSGDVEPDSGAILVTTKSDQMQPSLINDIVKEAARNAGVQHPLRPADPGPDDTVKEWFVTTHRIRRSAISHWVNDCEPISLHQARQLAGHARIQQTMDYVEDDQDQLGEDYHRSIQ